MTPLPLARFSAEFLGLYSKGKRAHLTELKMRQVLREVSKIPGLHTTADLTTAAMARYVEGHGPSANANTVNGKLDYLRAACRYAFEEGYLDRPPNWKRVRPRRTKTVKNRPISWIQAGLLLRHLAAQADTWEGRRLHALVSLVLLTGCRRDEALYALGEDVDVERRTFKIVERTWRRLKTEASARTVGMPICLADVLRTWIPETRSKWLFPGVKLLGPWTGGMCGHRSIDQLKASAKQVGIESITWHGLRHTYGTNALRHFDQPLWIVQRTMGHTDSRTTERYLHLDDAPNIIASVRDIAYGSPASPLPCRGG